MKVILETVMQEQGEKEKLDLTSKDLPLPNLNVQTNLFISNNENINQLQSFLRDKNQQIKELKQKLFQQKQRAEDKSFDKPSPSKNSSPGSSTEIDQGDKNIASVIKHSLLVKQGDINEMNLQISSKDQEIETLKKEKSQLQNSLQEKDSSTTEMNGQINSKDQEIESLRQQLREAENSISPPMNTNVQPTDNTDNSWVIRRSEITDYGEVLGNGGWGEVREAKFRGTKVAVKKLHNIILSSYNRSQFEREITIAMRVRHPNLVQFMGATDDDQEMLFVMEMLQTDLRSLLENKALEGSSLPDQQILQIAFDVIRALVYLHQLNPPIIHRDVSSANVLLYETKQGWRAKLSDYGSANLVAKSCTQNPGAAIYSAPEAGGNNQNQSLDVYSFGVLFCEMLTKEMPDPARLQAQVNKIANEDHRLLVTQCIKPMATQRSNSMDVLKQIDKWVTDKSNSNDSNPVQLRRSNPVQLRRSNPVQLGRSLEETSGSQSLAREISRSMVAIPSNSEDSERRYSVADIANSLKRLNLTGGSKRGPPTKPKPNKE